MSKLVIGAGRSGIAAAKFLARQGFFVTLSDLKCPADFPELAKEVRLAWGKQTGELLLGVDQVIVSPGIPLEIPIIQLAKEQAIEVIGELELFYRNCSLPILAVTGTNGKTTTATLLAKMIEKMGKPVLLGGNIGKALSEEADHLPEEGFVVLEVSSYQLEATKRFRPHIAGILNLTPDHLERHKTMENYQEMKEKLFINQTCEDILFLNQADPIIFSMSGRAKSQVFAFDSQKPVVKGVWGDSIGLWHNLNGLVEKIIQWTENPLPGLHNRENIAMATGMALCAGVKVGQIEEVIREFSGVEHRIEWTRTLNEVDYYNDSKGTNPDSTIKALESFERPVILLAGGYDKGNDLKELLQVAKKRKVISIFFGAARERFFKEATELGLENLYQATGLEKAVGLAQELSRAGDVVLLSPACSSFDEFANYEERGREFKKWVGELR